MECVADESQSPPQAIAQERPLLHQSRVAIIHVLVASLPAAGRQDGLGFGEGIRVAGAVMSSRKKKKMKTGKPSRLK